MADFSYVPSYASEVDQPFRVLRAQFGDGYSQRVVDGINSQPRKWMLKFENITTTTAGLIKTAITGYGGATSFTWDTPDGEEVTVTCAGIKEGFRGPTSRDLTLEFVEEFDS